MISETVLALSSFALHSAIARRRSSDSLTVNLSPASIFARTISRAIVTGFAAHCARMITGSMSRIRVIVFVLVSRALSTIVIMRPGPPGRRRLIEYRAHHRIASPVMNSPWLSKRIARGLGSASMSIRIVCRSPCGPCSISSAPPRTCKAAYAPSTRTRGEARAPSCHGVSFSLPRSSDQSPVSVRCSRAYSAKVFQAYGRTAFAA